MSALSPRALTEHVADLEAEIIYLKERLATRFDSAPLLCERLGLTPNQANLVLLFHTASGRVLSPGFIDDELPLAKGHSRESPKVIHVLICLLRKRLGPGMIGNKWGFGYFLTPAGLALVDSALVSP
jgi:DNA-binding response OmpR family regulator